MKRISAGQTGRRRGGGGGGTSASGGKCISRISTGTRVWPLPPWLSTLIGFGCSGAKKWYADIDGPAAPQSESGLASGKGLKFFAGLEANSFSRRDADLLAGARVPADAGLTRLDGADAQTRQVDAFAAAESILHGLEDGLNGLLSFGAGDAGFLHDGVDDVELNHANLRHSGSLC